MIMTYVYRRTAVFLHISASGKAYIDCVNAFVAVDELQQDMPSVAVILLFAVSLLVQGPEELHNNCNLQVPQVFIMQAALAWTFWDLDATILLVWLGFFQLLVSFPFFVLTPRNQEGRPTMFRSPTYGGVVT